MASATVHDLHALDPDAVVDEYDRRSLADLSDEQLLHRAAALVSVPKVTDADSFVLHAPLEVLARHALLPLVRPDQRERARQRIVWMAAKYEQASTPEPKAPDREYADVPAAVAALTEATAAADLDVVDGAAAWIGRSVDAADLAGLLGDDLVPRLSAAAHGPIFLYHLPRIAARTSLAASLLRGLARESARYPDWRLEWVDDWTPAPSAPTSLSEAMLATPRLGAPDGTFIFPLMHHVDRTGTAADVVGPAIRIDTSIAEGFRSVQRVAVLSMLQDHPDHSPYGWSHCLTMPQAMAGIAGQTSDPSRTLAVAATHVVGFRAGMSDRDIAATYTPAEEPVDDLVAALSETPAVAAATYHAVDESDHDRAVTALATRAGVHHDAHLAKYVLACLDAMRTDPSERRLYLAGAAYLAAWWAQIPADGDPLGTWP